MKETVRLTLHPLGKTEVIPKGSSLQNILFRYGVEFPCGGQGTCSGCRVRVLEGNVPVTQEHQAVLSPDELDQGWRLACCMTVDDHLTLELAQWETPILADQSVFEFTPAEGFGIAVDVGTTTLVAQLIDRRSGHVISVCSGLNPQAQHGSDLMTRIHYAVTQNKQPHLTVLVRQAVGELIQGLLNASQVDPHHVSTVVLVGNTVMHHFFCGLDVTPLSMYPFEPVDDGVQILTSSELQWNIPRETTITFLPCLGGFVGSDLLAGIVATRMNHLEKTVALIDLGTNGEILIGNQEKILCASTAAGPAFEGGRISTGMRASTGAICAVEMIGHELTCRVLGDTKPVGICGSGLVDAVACSLDLNWIAYNGNVNTEDGLIRLGGDMDITQKDVRELQLAKGAIAAGFRLLLQRLNKSVGDIETLYLAGAFGNTIHPERAKRIGMFNVPIQRVKPVGNSALLGAKIALFEPLCDPTKLDAIRACCEHVMLSGDPLFQEAFVDEMLFPEGK